MAVEAPEAFVARNRTQDAAVEAVVMPIGIHSAQVVLIAPSGEWLRFVTTSLEEARALCRQLDVEAHDGYPDHLRLRMAAWRRDPADWAAAPYPERTRGTSV